MKFILIVLSLFAIVSCSEPNVDYLTSTYNRLLDELIIECNNSDSKIFVKAKIGADSLCHFHNVNDRVFKYKYANTFTTSDPSFSTADSTIEVSKVLLLAIDDTKNSIGEGTIRIWLPPLPAQTDTIQYLDFILDKKTFIINGEDLSEAEIKLNMFDPIGESSGFNFPISSRYGPQNDCFVSFSNVQKSKSGLFKIYEFDVYFECDLFHYPSGGKEGFWKRLEGGHLHAIIPITEN